MAKWQILMIALFAGLVLGKMPSLLDGRLWAEDGLFLLDALRLPWWQALITPHTGYIDVVASGTMVVATHVADLEQVASISVLVACGVQVCPAILLIASRCDWLQPRWVLIVALLLVLLPPVSEEIWLSPVTSQYHLMLCTALILALPTGQRSMFVFQIMLLGIAGLTGPGPALVAPWFFVRAYLDRSWRRAIQGAVLAFGAMVEIGMVCTYPESNRHLGIELSLLFSVIGLKHIFLPLFGRHFVLSVTDKTILPATAAVTGLLGLGMMAFKAYGPERPLAVHCCRHHDGFVIFWRTGHQGRSTRRVLRPTLLLCPPGAAGSHLIGCRQNGYGGAWVGHSDRGLADSRGHLGIWPGQSCNGARCILARSGRALAGRSVAVHHAMAIDVSHPAVIMASSSESVAVSLPAIDEA